MAAATVEAEPGRPLVRRLARLARPQAGPFIPYAFVLPALAFVLVWAYQPLLETIRLSFFQGTLVSGPTTFAGWRNYASVLANPEFRSGLLNTGKYIAGAIPLVVVLPLGLALLTNNRGGRLRGAYRSIIFTPMLVSPVVGSLLWLWLLNPLQGLLNAMVQLAFGVPGLNWLGDERTAVWAIVLITGWKYAGLSFLLYQAAIAGIDRAYLDAARIDGASEWQVVRSIVLPLVTPATYFVLLLTLLYAGQWSFPPINVLTQGQPGGSTANVFFVLYQMAFKFLNVGESAAASVVVFLIMCGGIWAGVRLMDRRSRFDN